MDPTRIGKFTVVLILVWLSELFVAGAIVTPASLALADVQAAVNSATPGDTVQLPSGTVAWTDHLWCSNNVILMGAGTNLSGTCTIITNAKVAIHSSIILLRANNNTDRPRVTQLVIDGRSVDRGIESGVSAYTAQYRIDHCIFLNCDDRAINGTGGWGVIDHCQFLECNKVLRAEDHSAFGGVDWNLCPLSYDSTNVIYVEDCYIRNHTNGSTVNVASSGTGGSYAFRYCVFDLKNNNIQPAFDVHGPQGTNGWPGSINFDIGGIAFWFYNNTFSFGTNCNSSTYFIDLRGGQTAIVANNTFTQLSGSSTIRMRHEQASNMFEHAWPSINMCSNMYFWSNTDNGTNVLPIVSTDNGGYESNYIVLGVNYFTNPPSSYSLLKYPHPLTGIPFREMNILGKANFLGKATIH